MSSTINDAMTIKLDYELPEYPAFEAGIRRAPRRESHLTEADKALAIKNALRYIHPDHHEQMAKEFAQELEEHGRIYGYRFRPAGKLYGKPIEEYKGNCTEAKAFQVMIDNNLDFDVALYPYELVTYGESGQVCQNWMQYRLIKKYLEVMTDEQTLVVMSGHPLGLFHSHKLAPRCIISNGLMIGMYDDQKNFNRAAALGVANYGQMTAGGWMYIGPQGIVHGTFNTLLGAGRLKLGVPEDGNLAGRLFISAGLGGMSGAQGKAAEIAGAASIIAEVDDSRITTRYTQGWVTHRTDSLDEALSIAQEHLNSKTACAVAYHGNVVDLLEYLYEKGVHVDLMSDQTSCHMAHDGGYCPQGLTFEQRTEMLDKDPEGFAKLVDKTLKHHYEMICKFHEKGTYFFDYGNAFRSPFTTPACPLRRSARTVKTTWTASYSPPTWKTSSVPPCSTSAMAPSVGAACPGSPRTWPRPTRLPPSTSRRTPAAIRTTTTTSGSVMPARTRWSWAPSAGSCTPTLWAA